MEFLKDLIKIQHQQILNYFQINCFQDKKIREFINKFNKPNYQLIKVSNTKMIVRKRININCGPQAPPSYRLAADVVVRFAGNP